MAPLARTAAQRTAGRGPACLADPAARPPLRCFRPGAGDPLCPQHWDGLIRFLDDGRAELDTNTVERAIRPVAVGCKNALLAGADSGGRHWTIIASLIQTANLNEVDPLAWLTDVLERIVSGRTRRHELGTLLPWNWKPDTSVEKSSTA